MAQAAGDIINMYLHAVDGVALDHSKQAIIGYSKDPNVLYRHRRAGARRPQLRQGVNDAVHAAALDVLQHVEVIGGDLLMKRAHPNSPSNIPEPAPEGGGAPGQSQIREPNNSSP